METAKSILKTLAAFTIRTKNLPVVVTGIHMGSFVEIGDWTQC